MATFCGPGKEGNCASVAVIKAALDKYDGKVFPSVRKNGDGYAITMQDGKSITVTRGSQQGMGSFSASVVGYSSRHTVYIDSGKTDHYGRATNFNRTDTNTHQLSGAFTFA